MPIDLDFIEHPKTSFATAPQYAVKLVAPVTAEDGYTLVSKRCGSIEEFEAEINHLKGELDRILKAAHWRHEKGAQI